jgi:hypothetical protein
LSSVIGFPPLKPGTIRCDVMLVAPKRPWNPETREFATHHCKQEHRASAH